MRIFLTGATGFVGSAIVPELIGSGHQVIGLTRSDRGAKALEQAGAEPHLGDIDDLDSLRRGAAKADGVIHTAFDHSFRDVAGFVASCQKDRQVIEAIGDALAGSQRLLVITSGTGIGSRHGDLAGEDIFDADHPNPRIASETAGQAAAQRGVKVAVVRLSQIHDPVRQGLVSPFVAVARDKGVAAYVGDGLNCWSAAHVSDAARLYRLAFDRQEGGVRYHAVAEERVPMKDIAEAVGRGLKVPTRSLSPEEAKTHFGWIGSFVGSDMSASSAKTRERLGWQPTGPGLIADLEAMDYAAA